MSLNHFSQDLQEPLKWSHHHHPLLPPPNPWNPHFLPPTNTSLNFNLNRHDHDYEDNKDNITLHHDQELHNNKEPMFEKPLTPSDVGKLNRLVIPKQHAEKYFPLGGGGGDSAADKGFLLSFEDELGKFWRFRYSYWNSSQSYVLTKGWSRYVKEKRLDAGDVVLFERHRFASDRLFIGCRRRATAAAAAAAQDSDGCGGGGGGGWTRGFYSAHPYPAHHGHGPSVPYQPDCIHAGSANVESRTTQSGNSKTVRLFGVNLECQLGESEPSTPDSSPSSDHHQYHNFYSSPNNMKQDINVNQMRNRRG